MMRFPGDNYLLYGANPQAAADVKNYARAGVKRYLLFKNLHYVLAIQKHVPDYKEIAIVKFAEDKVTRDLNGVKKDAPIFYLTKTGLPELKGMVKKHDTIFVHCGWGHNRSLYAHYAKKYAEPMRWIYELQRDNPQVNFIAFGDFDFEIYFCSGLMGSAIDINIDKTWRVQPNGHKSLKSARTANQWLDREFHDETEGFKAIKMAQMVAPYLQNYYSLHRVGPVTKKPTPAEFAYGYIFRNSRIKEKRTELDRGARNPSRHRFLYNDGVLCATCSLSYCCDLYRPLGVCRVPGTEGNELAQKFATGSATDVIDGIAELVGFQAALVQKGIEQNEKRIDQGKDVDPGVSKMINDTIKNATTLAKLRNPNLTRPLIAIQNNNGAQQIEAAHNPQLAIQQMSDREMASIMDEMTRNGYPNRKKITEEDVLVYMSRRNQPQLTDNNTIDAQVVDEDNEIPF